MERAGVEKNEDRRYVTIDQFGSEYRFLTIAYTLVVLSILERCVKCLPQYASVKGQIVVQGTNLSCTSHYIYTETIHIYIRANS